MGHGQHECLDAQNGKEQNLIVYECHGEGANQYFDYADGFIKRDDYCAQFIDNQITFTSKKEIDSQVCASLTKIGRNFDRFISEMDVQSGN